MPALNNFSAAEKEDDQLGRTTQAEEKEEDPDHMDVMEEEEALEEEGKGSKERSPSSTSEEQSESDSFGVFVLSFPCSAPPSFEMTRMAFSGGLDTTGIVCFSGGSRSTSRPSVSSPRCSLYLGSSLVSCRSASLVSINVTQRLSTEDFRRISSSLPPQVLLPPLVSGDRTSAVCGAPRLTRRSDLEAFWLIWTISPRFTTTTFIPTRSRFKRLYYGYGEVRRADDSSAPSSIDGGVSLVDFGEINLPSADTPCFITGDCPFKSDKNPKLSSLPIKQAFSLKPRMLIFWAWPCKICESVIHLAGPPNLKLVFDDLLSVAKMQRISGGFTGAFILSLMPYFPFTKNSLPVGSPGWSLSSPYLLSMKGEEFPNSLLSSGFSFLVYESWSSKSLYVTISMLSDFVVKIDLEMILSSIFIEGIDLEDIRTYVQCPICLGIIRKTRTFMECLHRFCQECIDKSMRFGNHECPACRKHVASRRSLRPDPKFDAFIAAIFGNIDSYEEQDLAFDGDELARNMQIQATIAQVSQRQSEALVKTKSSGKDAPRSQPSGSGSRRRRRNSRNMEHDTSQAAHDDDGDNNRVNASSSAEILPRKRNRRSAARSTAQPSSSSCPSNNDNNCANDVTEEAHHRDSRGIAHGFAWGKGGRRSNARQGNNNQGASSSKSVRNARLNRLVDYLSTLESNSV
ncbi:hypothetical protein Bca101_068836 [Brassica carinata]